MKPESIESKQNKFLKQALSLGTAISIFLVFILLLTLVRHGHLHWLGDIDKSLLGIVGDFIGGIVGTIFTVIATFLIWLTYNSQKAELVATRGLVEKQLEATYHPHFAIKKNSQLYSALSDIQFADSNYGDFGSFNLELVNIGNEAAKEVLLAWEYFDENQRITKTIDLLSKLNTVEANQQLENLEYLQSYRDNRDSRSNYYGPMLTSYDFILPITLKDVESDHVNISLPYKMAVIFHELNTFLQKSLGHEYRIKNFGYVHLSYKNSLNNDLHQEFKLICNYDSEYVQGEHRERLTIVAFEP